MLVATNALSTTAAPWIQTGNTLKHKSVSSATKRPSGCATGLTRGIGLRLDILHALLEQLQHLLRREVGQLLVYILFDIMHDVTTAVDVTEQPLSVKIFNRFSVRSRPARSNHKRK